MALLNHLAIEPPEHLLFWLCHNQSMTDALYRHTQSVQLKVLNQSKINAGWFEHYVLHEQEEGLCREVLITSDTTPCWYARTWIPLRTLRNHALLLPRLACQSLGEILFHDPLIHRRQLGYYPVNYKALEFHWVPKQYRHQECILWVRAATFFVQETYPLYLYEILLPDFTKVV